MWKERGMTWVLDKLIFDEDCDSSIADIRVLIYVEAVYFTKQYLLISCKEHIKTPDELFQPIQGLSLPKCVSTPSR